MRIKNEFQVKATAPDLSPLTKDLLFNPGAISILARIEALSSSEIAQGGFKEFFREGLKK